ncbi:helix-turn-helix domain-containing protein [Kitasatospora sp. NPDC018058]|uniref:helix-turn-helix domain-containing protein n=1 Tax=Kitasatospora sp. NPDC018058 TaxID=3364025 RepID=UPI0037BF84A0
MTETSPWANPRLRAAWARTDWAAILREYRRAANISQTALAGLVGLSQADVSLIERGRRTVRESAVMTRITEGLNVPPELLNLSASASTWAPDPELTERIARAHTTGRTDIRSADWIARVLAEHRRAEDDGAGADLWPVVRSQLDTVTRLIPGASGPTADKLLLLSAEHAHWLSWVAHGQGEYGAALAWLGVAHGWALDAGSADMASWITRVRSYYQLGAGDPVRALRTAETAIGGGAGLSPSAASIASHTAAMAAAAVGERDRAHRLADEAYEAALRTPDEDDRPGWLYWLSPTRARLLLGEAAYAARDWRRAADALGDGLAELEGYPRDAAFYMAKLEDARRRA